MIQFDESRPAMSEERMARARIDALVAVEIRILTGDAPRSGLISVLTAVRPAGFGVDNWVVKLPDVMR